MCNTIKVFLKHITECFQHTQSKHVISYLSLCMKILLNTPTVLLHCIIMLLYLIVRCPGMYFSKKLSKPRIYSRLFKRMHLFCTFVCTCTRDNEDLPCC